LGGFDPVRDRLAESELLPLDRYMLAKTRDLTEKVRDWYAAFEFHRVYHAVNEFAIVDLSSFYLDVLKDRMYTFAPTSVARRSAQTVLWQIAEALVRLVAPILSFTADEVWDYLPQVEGREASVHLALFPEPDGVYSSNSAKLLEEWKQLFEIREGAMRVLEEARKDKLIGKGLEADIHFHAKGDAFDLLERHKRGLKELLNVSDVLVLDATIEPGIRDPAKEGQVVKTATLSENIWIAVRPASGHKCARCWNFMPHVSNYGVWENVCDRCQGALNEMGIQPPQPAGAPA
jgi:isoleucyl-tRNA synthetase